MDYPISEFNDYCNIVLDEMNRRGYKIRYDTIKKLERYTGFVLDVIRRYKRPFVSWHTLQYLNQCMSNLEEKFDCGGISEEEWARLCEEYKNIARKEFII